MANVVGESLDLRKALDKVQDTNKKLEMVN